MKSKTRLKQFLFNSLVNYVKINIGIDLPDGSYADNSDDVDYRRAMFPDGLRWDEQEKRYFCDRMVGPLSSMFGMERKESEIEISWFLYQYGILES